MANVPIRPLELLPESGIAIVTLTRDCFAIIDIADAAEVGKYNWHAQCCGGELYAARCGKQKGGEKIEGSRTIYLHRALAAVDGLPEVDHISRIKLDCRRSNLRPCTRHQNIRNTKQKLDGGSSKHKGVHWAKHVSRWVAQITVNRKCIHLGCFKEEEKAVLAYNEAARKYHGEFAWQNQL